MYVINKNVIVLIVKLIYITNMYMYIYTRQLKYLNVMPNTIKLNESFDLHLSKPINYKINRIKKICYSYEIKFKHYYLII